MFGYVRMILPKNHCRKKDRRSDAVTIQPELILLWHVDSQPLEIVWK